MKILIIGPAWVGDMIMAQTLFKAIKQNNNSAIIDVLALQWSNPVLARMAEVNNIITMPVGHGKLGVVARYKLGKQLRANHYDQAIILPNSWKSALIPFWAKIPLRTGWLGEMRWGLINDVRYLVKAKYPRMVDRFVALAYPKQYSGAFAIVYPTLIYNTANANAILARCNLQNRHRDKSNTNKNILAICPGAAFGPAKRWLISHFAAVINNKIRDNWDIWIFGSKEDREVIDKIMHLVVEPNGVQNFAGNINLLETIDLFSIVQAVISNDSGLMHIAASVNKPVIALYGSTTPNFTPPLTARAKILQKNLPCRPCFKRECPFGHYNCMVSIRPNAVLAALDELLALA